MLRRLRELEASQLLTASVAPPIRGPGMPVCGVSSPESAMITLRRHHLMRVFCRRQVYLRDQATHAEALSAGSEAITLRLYRTAHAH